MRMIDQRLTSAKENGTDLSNDRDMLATMLTMDVRQCYCNGAKIALQARISLGLARLTSLCFSYDHVAGENEQ